MTYCRKNCPLHFSTLPWNLRFLPYSPDEIKVVSPVAGNLRIGSKRNSVPTVDPVDQRIKIAKKRRNLLKMKQACSESRLVRVRTIVLRRLEKKDFRKTRRAIQEILDKVEDGEDFLVA